MDRRARLGEWSRWTSMKHESSPGTVSLTSNHQWVEVPICPLELTLLRQNGEEVGNGDHTEEARVGESSLDLILEGWGPGFPFWGRAQLAAWRREGAGVGVSCSGSR